MVKILISTSILVLLLSGCAPQARVEYPVTQEIFKVDIDYYYPEHGYGTRLDGIPLGTKVIVLFPEQYQAIEDELIERRLTSNSCKEVIDNHNRTILGKAIHSIKVKLRK